jgi:lycopene beta-cyclase
VVAASHQLELSTRPYTYRLVQGEDLAAVVEQLLAPTGRFTRLTGVVREVENGTDTATVRLYGARIDGTRIDDTKIETRWVLDSRPPPPPPPGRPRLRFLGREVTAPGASFDPSRATFLDFRARSTGEVRFCYVLPTSERQALVEIAVFGTSPGTRPDLETGLTRYLHEVCGLSSWQVLREEAGELPLQPAGPRRAGQRVLRVGAAGGMLKPSTGFAFDRIIRDAEAVVDSLDRYGHPWALPCPPRRYRWLDDVLLRAATDEPAVIERAYARLFARNQLPQVLRFLDEDTTLAEDSRLIATLPPIPFLLAARHCGLPTRGDRVAPGP